MPVHDWTRVDAGTFHAFHLRWIGELMGSLNNGVLPEGYYAMGEQIASGRAPDVLTLRTPTVGVQHSSPGVALAEAAPQVQMRMHPSVRPSYHRKTQSLVIRHASGHEVVAMIEIISRANKDRVSHIEDTAAKIVRFLDSRVHVLLIDLLPPTKHDQAGIHGKVWEEYSEEPYEIQAKSPLTLASYESTPIGPGDQIRD